MCWNSHYQIEPANDALHDHTQAITLARQNPMTGEFAWAKRERIGKGLCLLQSASFFFAKIEASEVAMTKKKSLIALMMSAVSLISAGPACRARISA